MKDIVKFGFAWLGAKKKMDSDPDWCWDAMAEDIMLGWSQKRDIIKWVYDKLPRYRQQNMTSQKFWKDCSDYICEHLDWYIERPDHLVALWERIRLRIKWPLHGCDTPGLSQWADYMEWWIYLPEDQKRLRDEPVPKVSALDRLLSSMTQRAWDRAEKNNAACKRKRPDEDDTTSKLLPSKKQRTEEKDDKEDSGPKETVVQKLDKLNSGLAEATEIFKAQMTTLTTSATEPVRAMCESMAQLVSRQELLQSSLKEMDSYIARLTEEQASLHATITHVGVQMREIGSQMSRTMEMLKEVKAKELNS